MTMKRLPLLFLLTLLAAPRTFAAETPDQLVPDKPLPWVDGSWTIAVLPDTQNYSQFPKNMKHFQAQTKWIAEGAKKHNIRYVLHLGDIVQHNVPQEWERAREAMRSLDGVVPYAIVAGNHDYGPQGNGATRDTLLSDYFRPADYAKWPTFGGTKDEGKLDNNFHLFEAGGAKFIIIGLEWGPSDAAVAWADELLSKHKDRRGILITHAYMFNDDTRYDWKKYGKKQSWNPHSYGIDQHGGCHDGEELWQKLVRKHPGMIMTLNGHVLGDGLARRTSTGVAGNAVHQMLVNYQMKPEGGTSWLRLLEFLPDGQTVQVRAYCPSLEKYATDEQNQFVLKLKPKLGESEK